MKNVSVEIFDSDYDFLSSLSEIFDIPLSTVLTCVVFNSLYMERRLAKCGMTFLHLSSVKNKNVFR